jgi:hypothetical protein
MKGNYTEAVHARRLIRMLKKDNLVHRCPALRNFADPACEGINHNYCHVCRKFVDINNGCPCLVFGEKEAIRRTEDALKRKRYM